MVAIRGLIEVAIYRCNAALIRQKNRELEKKRIIFCYLHSNTLRADRLPNTWMVVCLSLIRLKRSRRGRRYLERHKASPQ